MEKSLDIMSLALAFYRSPLNHQEWVQGQAELPPDVDGLLRVAGEESPYMNNAGQFADSGLGELREAAFFFIQQVFFARDANHYRVLGLNSDAKLGQIKEHHRLLIRLFHPDREPVSQLWTDSYATRVNEAYNILRNPQLRRVYNASLQSTQQQSFNKPFSPSSRINFKKIKRITKPPANHDLVSNLSPMLLRHFPQVVLSGTALLASLIVFGIYLSSGQMSTINRANNNSISSAQLEESTSSVIASVNERTVQTEQDQDKQRLSTSTLQFFPSEETVDFLLSHEQKTTTSGVLPFFSTVTHAADEPSRQPKDEQAANLPKSHHKPVKTKSSSNKDQSNASIDHKETNTQSASTALAPLKSHTVETKEMLNITNADVQKKTEKKPAPPQSVMTVKQDQDKQQRVKPLPQPVSLREKEQRPLQVASSGSQSSISQLELDTLIGRFIGAYDQGNVATLMTLFDAKARSNNRNNKIDIQRDYDYLFRITQSRQMRLRNLRWRQHGQSVRGDGGFQVQMFKSGEKTPKNLSGTIHFEVQKKGGKVLIKRLYHRIQ